MYTDCSPYESPKIKNLETNLVGNNAAFRGTGTAINHCGSTTLLLAYHRLSHRSCLFTAFFLILEFIYYVCIFQIAEMLSIPVSEVAVR
jgi:hypothetical protein